MIARIFWGIAFMGLSFFLPWWLTAVVGLLLLLEYRDFFEFVIAAFLIDSLYGISIPQFGHTPFLLTIIATLIFTFRRLVSAYLFNPSKAF